MWTIKKINEQKYAAGKKHSVYFFKKMSILVPGNLKSTLSERQIHLQETQTLTTQPRNMLKYSVHYYSAAPPDVWE